MRTVKVEPLGQEHNFRSHLAHLLGTMKYILFSAKLVGLISFTFTKETHNLNKISKKKAFFESFLFLCAYFFMFVLGFSDYGISGTSGGDFYSLVKLGYHVASSVNTLLQVLVGYLIKLKLANWFNSLAWYDVSAQKLGLTMDWKKIKKLIVYLAFRINCFMVLKLSLYIAATNTPWSVRFCVSSYNILKSVFKIMFIVLIENVHLRFKAINNAFDSFNSDDYQFLSSLDADGLKLTQLCKLHFRLCFLAEKLNGLISFYLFQSFSVSLGAVLFFSYYLYHTLLSSEGGYFSRTILVTLFGAVALFDEILDCCEITQMSTNLCNTANDTPKHLHELRNRLEGYNLDNYVLANSLQFLHQKILFTAQGYFEISFSVLGTMAETVITYLVLFIQYDQAQLEASISLNTTLIKH